MIFCLPNRNANILEQSPATNHIRSAEFQTVITLETIEGPVLGEPGKIYSTKPEVAIGGDGKTYFIKGCNTATAFSEVVGCRLAALAGLQVPDAVVGIFDGMVYAAVEAVPNVVRNIWPWVHKQSEIDNRADFYSVVAVDTWLVNDDRNLGNVVGSSVGKGRIKLYMIDFEKSRCLGENPFLGSTAVEPRRLWPTGELGTRLRRNRPPHCDEAVLNSIRALSVQQIQDVILPIAAELPFVSWHENSIDVLVRRAKNLDTLVEEVWAIN